MAIYAWEEACVKAILETDIACMPTRIAAARFAISQRIDAPEVVGAEEEAEIENALQGLRKLELGSQLSFSATQNAIPKFVPAS